MSHATFAAAALSMLAMLLAVCAGPSRAEEFHCGKASMPMDFVICSKPELTEANARLAETWHKSREGLDDLRKRELVSSQRQWMENVSVTCNLPRKGRPSSLVISQSHGCILQELSARTDALQKVVEAKELYSVLETTLWAEGPYTVKIQVTDEGENLLLYNGKSVTRVSGGMTGHTHVVWKKPADRSDGPDLLIFVLSGGSASHGDYVSFHFSSASSPQVLSFDGLEKPHLSLDERGLPTFFVPYGLPNLFSDWIHDHVSVSLPMHWAGNSFDVDKEALRRSAPGPKELAAAQTEITPELRKCRAYPLPGGAAPCSAPRTTEVLLRLILADRQEEAKDLLMRSWPEGMSGRDQLWNDFPKGDREPR